MDHCTAKEYAQHFANMGNEPYVVLRYSVDEYGWFSKEYYDNPPTYMKDYCTPEEYWNHVTLIEVVKPEVMS